MLGVVLGSRFPMLLWWGPDLLHLYNDAYRPILRDKHPASLAAPAADVWAEVWDVAGPMARRVQEGGPATWTEDLQLFINSGSMAEETYFTFSYSPVPGDDGRVGGVLNTVQETTAKVQGERQIRMLRDLAASAAEAKSEEEAYRRTSEILSANALDIPFVLIYALADGGEAALLAVGDGWKNYSGPAIPPRIAINPDAEAVWPIAEVVRTGREVVIDDLAVRFGELPPGRWGARPERAIALPVSGSGQATPYAVLIVGISPHRAFDERYQRFFRATADQVMTVVTNARAYEQGRKRADELAALDRAKTAFFSNVSHEFRTPLTLILGPVEDALARPARSLQGEELRAVHRSGLRLLRLVNTLLDFARLEAGRLQMSYTPTNLAAVTTDLVGSFRALMEKASLRLVIDCPPLPEPVYVDGTQWEKIVLNLVSNAFKFTLQGEIAVSLRWAGDYVVLAVRDTGTGIPSHELPRLFERFHRIEGAKSRSFEGTGIGLSLVHELVSLHGGTVRVSSVIDQGTTFEVSIPTGSAHLPPETVFAGEVRASSGAGAASYVLEASHWNSGVDAKPAPEVEWQLDPPPARARQAETVQGRARILIVDDNADMRECLARFLAPNFAVDVAPDGGAALARALAAPPDLVLSDVMMPVLDGFELVRRLRAEPRTREIPVVLLSARAGEESLVEGLETGADDYLVKPFSPRELLARVQTHLQMARLRRNWAKELTRANEELESFSYSVSHDLRAPLRTIDGFSGALLEEYGGTLSDEARGYLNRVRTAAKRMSSLIDDLLGLARIGNAKLQRKPVDLTELARRVLAEIAAREPGRRVDSHIADGLVANADPGLVTVMFENLLGNAWKFTGRRAEPRIHVGQERREDARVFFVRDNGAGFDMAHAKKLFAPFQRLHREAEFTGTGVGLATVRRIIARHDGQIWAEADEDRGATFFFTLGR